jgi:Fe-S-cluster-containing hydrogenase component 2
MSNLEDHPTVRAVRGRPISTGSAVHDIAVLRDLCLNAGADDVGFVALDRPELNAERADVLRIFPATRTLIAFVRRMNPDCIRSPARNVANHEFHQSGDEVNEIARQIVSELGRLGVRAVNPPMAFPMEMERFPGKVWSLSLKPLAVAAGLGQMGIHRNVIHPKFGNFVLLGAVLIDKDVSEQTRPIDYNPCLTCKLCVAACPVGAIGTDGSFNFTSCFTHNYREFMGGFTDWVETVADSRNPADYRTRVTDAETASMWQSLSFGANYKAAYCMAVCPAGEDVIGPFLQDRGGFVSEVVKPLQRKEEPVYVQPNSDAEDHVSNRFPHKPVRRVGAVMRPTSIRGFIASMHLAFQPGRSKGLAATYHFRFTGAEPAECTVTIRNRTLEVRDGLQGRCDLRMTADSRSWLRLLRKEVGIIRLLLTFRVRLRGNVRLLAAFGKCFP